MTGSPHTSISFRRSPNWPAQQLSEKAVAQVEGRSLVPLLQNPQAVWEDRVLVTHVGRWPKGANIDEYKYAKCSVRTTRWHMVCDRDREKHWQLFDVQKDPGETSDLTDENPQVVNELDAAYDNWWKSLPLLLVNENAVAPQVNPFKAIYEKQFGDQANSRRRNRN